MTSKKIFSEKIFSDRVRDVWMYKGERVTVYADVTYTVTRNRINNLQINLHDKGRYWYDDILDCYLGDAVSDTMTLTVFEQEVLKKIKEEYNDKIVS